MSRSKSGAGSRPEVMGDLRRITYRVFQHPESGMNDKGKVVAITSATPGEGVTFVAHLMCRELAGDRLGRTLYCSTESLADALLETKEYYEYAPTDAGYWVLKSREERARKAWYFSPSVRCARLERLRRDFDYVIVDCPAVCGSGEVAGLASLTDCVLLVVAAGKSTRNQLLYAQQVIADSGGSLEGCILNRRVYPIPRMLYRFFQGRPR